MDVGQFFDIWEKTTIALSDAECGRLLKALVAYNQKAENKTTTVPNIMNGREKLVYPYFCSLLEKATKERTV